MSFMLAVSGKKQSGKDTLVSYLNPIFQAAGQVEYFTFADQLKKFLVEGMGLDRSSVWGSDKEKNALTDYVWDNLPYEIRRANAKPGSNEAKSGPMSGREIMQVFGTDIMRNFFDDKIWVNACFRAIRAADVDFALLPDMRFPSELDPWINRNGYIIRLMRDVSQGDAHSSEVALDYCDWDRFGNQVLVVPADATKRECLQLALEWLTPLIEDYLADYTDADTRIASLRESIELAIRTPDE